MDHYRISRFSGFGSVVRGGSRCGSLRSSGQGQGGHPAQPPDPPSRAAQDGCLPPRSGMSGSGRGRHRGIPVCPDPGRDRNRGGERDWCDGRPARPGSTGAQCGDRESHPRQVLARFPGGVALTSSLRASGFSRLAEGRLSRCPSKGTSCADWPRLRERRG